MSSAVDRPSPDNQDCDAPPAAARTRRRLFAAAGLLAVILAAAAALAPWLYSSVALRDAVASQLETASGLTISARGAARLALLPRPHIALEGLRFSDRGGALTGDAEALYGALNLFALAAGRLELSGVQLLRPKIALDLDRAPVDAPGAGARAAAAPPATREAREADRFLLGVASIVDGGLRVTRGGRGATFDKIDVTLDWRRVGEPLALTGGVALRGERLQGRLWIARPGALLRGQDSIVTARVDGESLRLEAQGAAQLGAEAHFSGHISGAAGDLREALRLFDLSPPLPGALNRTQFTARAAIGARQAELKDLRLDLDGNQYAGEAAWRREGGRAAVTATLASEYLSLKSAALNLPALVEPDGQWSKEPFSLPDFSGVDIDLRLKAAHARLDRLALDNADMIVTLHEGALDLALANARAYKGAVKLRLIAAPATDGLTLRADAETTGVDAGAWLRDPEGRRTFGGALDSTVTLDSAGGNMATLMRKLRGRAAFTLAGGEVHGLDLERALRRLESRPLASARDFRTGRTAVDHASGSLAIDNGVADITEGAARGPGFTLTFSGAAHLAERSLSISARAREADSHGKPTGAEVDIDLAGGWDDLSLTTDPRAFIRRSDAAAPLLAREPEGRGEDPGAEP